MNCVPALGSAKLRNNFSLYVRLFFPNISATTRERSVNVNFIEGLLGRPLFSLARATILTRA